jgi:hypothetical protein
LLGVLHKSAKQTDAIVGFAAGILTMAVLFYQTSLAWTWFTFVGCAITMMVGSLSALLRGRDVSLVKD